MRPGVALHVRWASLFVLLVVWVPRESDGTTDMFTALAHMHKMLYAEQSVAQQLRQYVNTERERIDAIEALAKDYERHSEEALDDPERHLSNPVNAYLLIKRFSVDWNKTVDKYFSASVALDSLTTLHIKTNNFPDRGDLIGSAMALLRLQDTYDMPTDSLARGELPGVNSTLMNADDCFQLGVIAYDKSDFYHSILWHSKALELDEKEEIKTANRSSILDYLAHATYKRGNIGHAHNLTAEWVRIDPDHSRARSNLEFYTNLRQQNANKSNESLDEIKNERIKDEYKAHEEFDAYERLCRGERTHNIDERELTCQYRRHHPMFFINPLKEEILHIKPRIVIYHKVMTEAEISKMKELAVPKLHRSGVFSVSAAGNAYTDYRTSQSAWIDDAEDPLIARLSQRAKAMTNLTLDTVEMFQVLNYGIGGHYEPHFDFARPNEIAFDAYRGNRIATVIYYMSDVNAGGRTVFNTIGVGSPPERGSCIVWFNLLHNGEGDYKTKHAGCPVLSGNKWVVNKWFHEVGQEFIRPCSLSPSE